MQQLGHLAQVLCLKQIRVFGLQVSDQCRLLVYHFVLLVHCFDQDFVVLRESLNSVFEFLLGKCKE